MSLFFAIILFVVVFLVIVTVIVIITVPVVSSVVLFIVVFFVIVRRCGLRSGSKLITGSAIRLDAGARLLLARCPGECRAGFNRWREHQAGDCRRRGEQRSSHQMRPPYRIQPASSHASASLIWASIDPQKSCAEGSAESWFGGIPVPS